LTSSIIIITILTVSSEICEMRHSVFQLTGTSVLAGAQPGRLLLAKLVVKTANGGAPYKVFLDFDGIEAATASFLRESVFGFRDFCLKSAPTVYPVLANLSEAVKEEVAFFARERGEAIWCCKLTVAGRVAGKELIGLDELEAGQQQALNLVDSLPEATAPTMARKAGDTVGPTAWNNRLAALASKGLIVTSQRGKTKVFHPVWRIA
jgi:hypothetical protein